jgi:HD-GYP domain-containing protein (c-di-GMP phosphodiesterase class II)
VGTKILVRKVEKRVEIILKSGSVKDMNEMPCLKEKLENNILNEVSAENTGYDSLMIHAHTSPEYAGEIPNNVRDARHFWHIFEEAVRAMGQMMEVRDPYTAGHQSRVSQICLEIGRIMQMPAQRLKGLELAALVHDVGKLAIPSEILSKPGRLSSFEFDLIKTHPMIGFDIMKGIEFPWPVAKMILQHHERMDGSGYPNGVSEHDLLLESRILSVADVIEAMSSNRPYRPALGLTQALAEIRKNKVVLYDGDVVEACLEFYASTGCTA